MSGRLIALEGIDCDVLNAQAAVLAASLRGLGQTAVVAQEPTNGPVGAQLRMIADGRLLMDESARILFTLADRMDHLFNPDGILADLETGKTVLCTRYLLSTYAERGPEVDCEWILQIHHYCRWPDLTLLIDTPVEVALSHWEQRMGSDLSARPLEQERLLAARKNYLSALEQCWPAAVSLIDGSLPATTISRQCMDKVQDL